MNSLIPIKVSINAQLITSSSIEAALNTLLVCFYRPELVEWSKVEAGKQHDNLERAFRLAEQHLDIARLLDPEGALLHHCVHV